MAKKDIQERASFTSELAQRVKKARVDLGLSQRELGIKAGLTQQQISHLEAEQRSLTAFGIVKLAKALGVTTDYLLTGERGKWESKLLERFSALPEYQKQAVKTILDQTLIIAQETNSQK